MKIQNKTIKQIQNKTIKQIQKEISKYSIHRDSSKLSSLIKDIYKINTCSKGILDIELEIKLSPNNTSFYIRRTIIDYSHNPYMDFSSVKLSKRAYHFLLWEMVFTTPRAKEYLLSLRAK